MIEGKGVFKSMKRKIAALLCMVLVGQLVLPSLTLSPAMAAENKADMIGTPIGAFDQLYISAKEIMSDGQIQLETTAKLKDTFLQEHLKKICESAYGIDTVEDDVIKCIEEEAFFRDTIVKAKANGVTLPEITYEGTFKSDQVSIVVGKDSGDLISGSGEKLGSYIITTTGGKLLLKITLDPIVYARTEVNAGASITLKSKKEAGEGGTVTVKPDGSGGEIDITVTPGSGGGDTGDVKYTLEKEVLNGERDKASPNIEYLITANAKKTTTRKTGQVQATATVTTATRTEAMNTAPATGSTPHELELDERLDVQEIFDDRALLVEEKKQTLATATNSASVFTAEVSLLAGKTIVDTIPDGMTLTEAAVEINGGSKTPLTESDYTINGSTLTYTIPAITVGVGADEMVKLYLTMKLTDKKYASSIGKTPTIRNTVSLKDPTSSDKTLAGPVTADAQKDFNIMSKDGNKDGLDGTKYKWDIRLKTYFSGPVNTFLVDRIQDIGNTHDYLIDMNHPLTITYEGGREEKITSVEDVTDDAAGMVGGIKKFDKLKFFDQPTGEYLSALTGSGADCVRYNYTEGATKTALLIIPTDEYLGAPVTISYYTVISGDLSAGGERDLKNDVKLVGERVLGEGIGPDDFTYKFAIDKGVTAKFHQIEKTFNGYDAKTQIITWDFEINQCRRTMDTAVITDTFAESGYLLDDATFESGKLEVGWYKPDGDLKKDTILPKDDNTNPDGYYSIVNDPTEKTNTIKIYLKNITLNDILKFSLKAKLVDPAKLATQGNLEVANTAGIVVNAGEADAGSEEVTVKKEVANVLIDKAAINYQDSEKSYAYDYLTQSVKWKVTVNQNFIPIEGMVWTDTLPLGTEFGKLLSMSRTYLKDGREETENVTITSADGQTLTDGTVISSDFTDRKITVAMPSNPNPSISANTIAFSVTNGSDVQVISQDKFELEFTTKVAQTYLDTVFNKNAEVKFKNTVKLTGEINAGGNTGPVSLTDDAEHTVTPKPLLKSGSFKQGIYSEELGKAAWLEWKIQLNAHGNSWKGAIIEDVLEPCMELDPASIKIYELKVGADGSLTADMEAEEAAIPLTDCTYRKLEFTIPQAYDKIPLEVHFNTLIVKDADAADMKNKVSVKFENNHKTETGEVTGSGAQSIDMEQFVTASTAPFIKIGKTSTNVVDGQFYPLAGAEFQAAPSSFDATGSVWNAEADLLKTSTTPGKGYAYFMYLKYNRIYELTETKAPAGYEVNPQKEFVIVLDGKSSNGWNAALAVSGTPDIIPAVYKEFWQVGKLVIIDRQTKQRYEVKKQAGVESDPAFTSAVHIKSGEDTIWQDSPSISANNTGEVYLKKIGADGGALPGVTFKLKNNKNLQPRDGITDTNGIVHFDKLDPGVVYTVEETETVNGYQILSKKIQVEVLYDATNAPAYTSKVTWVGGDGTELPTDPTDPKHYLVENKYQTAEVKFSKKNQNGDSTVPSWHPVAFDIHRDGDGGTINTAGDDYFYDFTILPNEDWKPYFKQKTTDPADANAVILAENLVIGNYKLTETVATKDLLADRDEAVALYFTVVQTNGRMNLTNVYYTIGDSTDKNVIPATAISASNDVITLAASEALPNSFQYGYLHLNKVGAVSANAAVTAPLANVRFQVYRDKNINSTVEDGELFLTLKTNARGDFDHDEGWYTDADALPAVKKQFLLGEQYLIREAAVQPDMGSYYTKYTEVTAFEIPREKRNGAFVHIAYSGTGVPAAFYGALGDPVPTDGFYNLAARGDITLTKRDTDTNQLLSDAEFVVYIDAEGTKPIASLKESAGTGVYRLSEEIPASQREGNSTVYDKLQNEFHDAYLSGDARSGWKLLYGSYYIKEVKTPDDTIYSKPTAMTRVEVTTELPNVALMITNGMKGKDFSITKKIEQSVCKPGETADDFGFVLKGKHANDSAPVTYPKDGSMYLSTGDSGNGTAEVSFTDVMPGTYRLFEIPITGKTEAYQGLLTERDCGIEITVRTSGVTFENDAGTMLDQVTIENHLLKGSIQGVKLSAKNNASQNPAVLAGARIGLYLNQADAAPVLTETTGVDGKFQFKEIPYGTYYVKEIKAPTGYQTDQTVSYKVVISETAKEVTAGERTDGSSVTPGAAVAFTNENLLALVSLKKQGTATGSNQIAALTEAEFTVYTSDGTAVAYLNYAKEAKEYVLTSTSYSGKKLNAYTAGGSGVPYLQEMGEKGALICGSYYIVETTVPDGYVAESAQIQKEKYKFEIVDENGSPVLKRTGSGWSGKDLILNMRPLHTLTVEKHQEQEDGTVVPGAGYLFEIKLTDLPEGVDSLEHCDTLLVESGDSVEITGNVIRAKTGQNGYLTVKGLPMAEYTVTEILPEGSVFRATQEQKGKLDADQTLLFQNIRKRANIEGMKTRNGENALKGATMGLFPAGATEFKEENLYLSKTAVSGEDGKFTFSDLAMGTYLIAELKAPGGYNLNRKTSYEVILTEDGATITEGIKIESEIREEAATAITILNTPASSGGGGGGGTPSKPSNPSDPKQPANPGPGVPTAPGTPEQPTSPGTPEQPSAPSAPGTPERPQVPVTPADPGNPGGGNKVVIPEPPGTNVVVRDPNGNDITTSTIDSDGNISVDLPPGTYTVVTLNEDGIPLASYTFTIEDAPIPNAVMAASKPKKKLFVPDAGDHSLPTALLAVLLLGALSGVVILLQKKKKLTGRSKDE